MPDECGTRQPESSVVVSQHCCVKKCDNSVYHSVVGVADFQQSIANFLSETGNGLYWQEVRTYDKDSESYTKVYICGECWTQYVGFDNL